MDTPTQQTDRPQHSSPQDQGRAPASTPQPLALQQPQDDDGAQGRISAATGEMMLSEQDKMWVDKARAAVERTEDDPAAQNREISNIRIQYLESRFGKQIKADEK